MKPAPDARWTRRPPSSATPTKPRNGGKIQRRRQPKCNCYTGLEMAAIARKHLSEPKLASRAALLGMQAVTKADAVAALDLVAGLEGDGELTDHLLGSLRSFLEVA